MRWRRRNRRNTRAGRRRCSHLPVAVCLRLFHLLADRQRKHPGGEIQDGAQLYELYCPPSPALPSLFVCVRECARARLYVMVLTIHLEAAGHVPIYFPAAFRGSIPAPSPQSPQRQSDKCL